MDVIKFYSSKKKKRLQTCFIQIHIDLIALFSDICNTEFPCALELKMTLNMKLTSKQK